jgi:hypothetical protein
MKTNVLYASNVKVKEVKDEGYEEILSYIGNIPRGDFLHLSL